MIPNGPDSSNAAQPRPLHPPLPPPSLSPFAARDTLNAVHLKGPAGANNRL